MYLCVFGSCRLQSLTVCFVGTKDTVMEQLASALHPFSTEPVQLVQEAANGNTDVVKATITRHPEQVSHNK